MPSRRAQAIILVVALGVAITLGITANPFGAKAGSGPTLAATSFAALGDSSNIVPGVPDAAKTLGPAYAPAAGTVHSLSSGAYAWKAGNQTCWATSHASGCLDPLAQPIDWSVGDEDVAGSGAPTKVFGLAVDGVGTVTAALSDGTVLSAQPASNFFSMSLPVADGPWDVTSVSATFGTGGSYSTPVHIPKPASQ